MRMSPVNLHRMVLALHRAGVAQDTIANNLGLHPATVKAWLESWRHSVVMPSEHNRQR